MEKTINYASFKVRVGGAVIDISLFLIITIPLLQIIYGDKYWESEITFIGIPDFLISCFFPFTTTVLFLIYKQATLGKILFKIQVVDEKTKGTPTVSQSILRCLSYNISLLPMGLGWSYCQMWRMEIMQ